MHNNKLIKIKTFLFLLLPAITSTSLLASPAGMSVIESGNDTLIKKSIQFPDTVRFLSPYDVKYTIKKGDSLSLIFKRLGLKYSDLIKIMETDLNYLSLDTIQPGHVLRFWKGGSSNKLIRLELQTSLAESVNYTVDGDSYEYSTYRTEGTWKESTIKGKIILTLSGSAKKYGLSKNEIADITSLFQNKIKFSSDLRKGDKFEVVRRTEYIHGQKTGRNEIAFVRLETKKGELTAVLHSDGQFYDRLGQSLEPKFDRVPVNRAYRISSSFNPNRKHPVTGRRAPHNGTDFAVPTGTVINSVGGGKVIIIRDHPYAGKYVVIKHNNTYKTRYLHMSKILVKKGDIVKRGQKIGLSGSTGRVTGPHLHYEMLIHDKAVNPMTAKIPLGNAVPDDELDSFLKNENRLEQFLDPKQDLPEGIRLAQGGSPAN